MFQVCFDLYVVYGVVICVDVCGVVCVVECCLFLESGEDVYLHHNRSYSSSIVGHEILFILLLE